MKILSFSLSLTLCLVPAVHSKVIGKKNSDRVISCYFKSWSVYRAGDEKFDVENIDPTLCTHAIYGFAGIENNQIISLDPYNDLPDNYGKGAYLRFTNLTKKNPDLVPMLAIGGWNEGSEKYSQMVSSDSARKTFVDSVVAFLSKYNFQGLDIDWEYPTQRGGLPSDKANFVKLLKELRAAFDSHSFVLTATVSADFETIDAAYDVSKISKYLDHIHVMTYDLYGPCWSESYTAITSPLHPRKQDTEEQQNLTIERAIQHWLDKGAPKDKLVVGLPLYGLTYTLANSTDHDIFSPATGIGTVGQGGTILYSKTCLLPASGWNIVRDETFESPYMFKEDQWISYEDPQSLAAKTQYAVQFGLKGVVVWSIDNDDFIAKCKIGSPFPLMNSIKDSI